MSWLKTAAKIITVVPALIDATKFVVAKVKARRKARLTPEQRDAAWSEASDRLDDILEKVDTKREKKPK